MTPAEKPSSGGGAATRASAGRTSVLERYVELHNAGVRSGDFDALLALFTADGEVHFVGRTIGPFRGIEALRRAFQQTPPDDELVLAPVALGDRAERAEYAWKSAPGAIAGMLIAETDGEQLRVLRVVPR